MVSGNNDTFTTIVSTHNSCYADMSKKPSSSGGLPGNLPDDFFDTHKKSQKAQEDDLSKELEQFEQEMAALEAESEEKLKEEFEKLQEDKNIDELDQQIEQWKRIVELEKKAEELQNRPISENPKKKVKINDSRAEHKDKLPANLARPEPDDFTDLDDIEDFEDKLFDWRSKRL